MKNKGNILLLVSIVVCVLTSWYMWTRPLWSFVPLFNYLSIWGIFLWLFRKSFTDDSPNGGWLKLVFISGIILSVGFPPSPLFIGLMVGFVPLMMLENEIRKSHNRPQPGKLFKYLFFGFWLWNILTTFWIANTAFIAGIVANVVNAALMTLPWLVFHVATFRSNWKGRYIILASGWILFEYLHTQWDISWPWLTLGNGLTSCYPLIQWYEITGYFGGSVWIWLVNILVGMSFIWPERRRKFLFISALTVIIPASLSLLAYINYKEKGTPLDVSVVQPNFEPHYQKFSIPEPQQVEKIFRMTSENIDSATRLVIMPETVLDPVNLDEIYGENRGLAILRSLLKQAPHASILGGVGGYHIFHQNPGRETVRKNGSTFYELYNAAILMEPDIDTVQEYHKSKFVPGAELFPFKKVLPFLKPLVRKLGGTYEGFAPQSEPSNFRFDGGKQVAPIICYESIYGGWVAGYVRKGAGLLAIITNDGWWDNTPGHLQHMSFARLRAIENRKDIARSANTGTSCFVNQRGDVRMKTGYNEDAVIRDKVFYNEGTTFYSRHGDYIVAIMVIVFILSMVYNFLPKMKGN
ncbi:MAG: apolipoprotein N-acyltransferase [Saprospiraceae bacterium]|nr:apolipoprotein N-acyltransferase [Saprospiraceae bacterium]